MAAKKVEIGKQIVAQNRRARHDYMIEENIEAGIVLKGTEVKSLRQGRASVGEAYAGDKNGEMYLINAYIPPYEAANQFNHEPRAPRKLLLKKKEMAKLLASQARQGITLVPLSIYFNDSGLAKVDLGIAAGRKKADKRQHDKDQDWKRQQARIMRDRG